VAGFLSVHPLGAVPTLGQPPRTALPSLPQPIQVRRPLPLARVCGGSPGVRRCKERGPRPRCGLEARGGPVKLLCNLLVGESTQVPALRSVSPVGASPPWVLEVVRTLAVGLSTRDCLVLVKKAFKLAKVVPD
jgi:hypothetical protein